MREHAGLASGLWREALRQLQPAACAPVLPRQDSGPERAAGKSIPRPADPDGCLEPQWTLLFIHRAANTHHRAEPAATIHRGNPRRSSRRADGGAAIHVPGQPVSTVVPNLSGGAAFTLGKPVTVITPNLSGGVTLHRRNQNAELSRFALPCCRVRDSGLTRLESPGFFSHGLEFQGTSGSTRCVGPITMPPFGPQVSSRLRTTFRTSSTVPKGRVVCVPMVPQNDMRSPTIL